MKRIGLQLIVQAVALSVFAQTALGGVIAGKIKPQGMKAVENALVYIEGKVEGKKFSPPVEPVIMDQKDLTFIPYVLPITVGTTVEFPNSDYLRHNVYSPSEAGRFNLGTYPPGETKRVVFDKPGVVELLCNVHDEMVAFIVVLENPYYALTDDSGNFSIPDVPPGSYNLKVWHKKLAFPSQKVEVTDGQPVRVEFQLEP